MQLSFAAPSLNSAGALVLGVQADGVFSPSAVPIANAPVPLVSSHSPFNIYFLTSRCVSLARYPAFARRLQISLAIITLR